MFDTSSGREDGGSKDKMGLLLGELAPAPAGALSFLLRLCYGAVKAASTEVKALLS
jgi:hypothetical protein